MNRQSRRGFTLTELLIVILIIAVLVALLMPTLASAVQMAYKTQCVRNLNAIHQAVSLWMKDKDTAMFPTGDSWNWSLVPYTEGRVEVFICPAGPDADNLVASYSGSGGAPGTPGSSGTGGSETKTGTGRYGGDNFDGPGTPPPQQDYATFSFDVYDGPSLTNFLWNVSIDSVWCHSVKLSDNEYQFSIEDQGWNPSLVNDIGHPAADLYEDIVCSVKYKDGIPQSVTLGPNSVGHSYRFNFLINGKVVVRNIDAVLAQHPGLTFQLAGDPHGASPPTTNPSGSTPPGSDLVNDVLGTIGTDGTVSFGYRYAGGTAPTNYGLNLYSYYDGVACKNVTKPDAKLFCIMDYGKSLIDVDNGLIKTYSADSSEFHQGTLLHTTYEWEKYFITDVAAWQRLFAPQGFQAQFGGSTAAVRWQDFQSLRHFGQANVLFCDGHVESLGVYPVNELSRDLSNPHWRYTGR